MPLRSDAGRLRGSLASTRFDKSSKSRVLTDASSSFCRRESVDCEQAETRRTHAQLRSGRHDNAKVTVTTPKRVQQAERHCTALQTATRDASAANGSRLTVYKRVQRLSKSLQTSTARTSASKQQPRRDGAVTTPLFLVSEASTRRNARSSAHETNYS